MKISNIDLQKLRSSLRTSKSPGKRKLANAIKEENYTAIVIELLFRFELYCSEKVLRYTKADQNQIVNNILLHGVDVVAESVIETYYSEENSFQV